MKFAILKFALSKTYIPVIYASLDGTVKIVQK